VARSRLWCALDTARIEILGFGVVFKSEEANVLAMAAVAEEDMEEGRGEVEAWATGFEFALMVEALGGDGVGGKGRSLRRWLKLSRASGIGLHNTCRRFRRRCPV